jgi:hypothetical protein
MRHSKSSRLAALAVVPLLAAGAAITASVPAWAAGCQASLGGSCGPYLYSGIPMSNGYDTYVVPQDVGANSGTTATANVTDPGNWNTVANATPYGYGGVQIFADVQQLTNDWNGSGWGSGSSDTPLSALSALSISYSESMGTRDSNTSAEFAPDIWTSEYPNDVMFWADTQGRCNSGAYGGTVLGTATFDGQTWTVNRYGGAGAEIIFVLDSDPNTPNSCAQQTSGAIDIKAGFNWLISNGYLPSATFTQMNTGWEITSAANETFTMSSYSINATVGSGQQAPAVTTNAATSVASSGATLNGSVNPEGAATTYQFDYGTTTSYGSSVPSPAGSAGSGTTAVNENASLTGLSPSTTYHYRIEATNSAGTTYGADQQFTTSAAAQAPAVVTSAASGITSSGATLNGTVNPEGQATTWQYQYGTTTAYGSAAPASPGSAGSGTSAVSEPQAVTGLSPSTTYHYRLTATNATGTTNGSDQQFTTASPGITVTASVTHPWDSVVEKVYVITGGTTGGAVTGAVAYGTPAFSLTPVSGSSRLLSEVLNSSDGTAVTPVSGVTTDASGTTPGFGEPWQAGHYTGTVTAGHAVTLGGTDSNHWNAYAGYEVKPSAAGVTPAIDASTPAVAVGSSSSAVTGSFSPPAGSLLVAFVETDGTAAQAVTVSGGGLTWTQRGTTHSAGYEGTTAVFTATAG